MKEYKSNKLGDSIQYIKGVGPKVADILSKIGIKTIQDILYYFPRSYDDRRQIPKINQLVIGDKQKCLGIIKKVSAQKTRNRKSIIKAVIEDETGKIDVLWFNQPYLKKNLKPGQKILISGKYELNQYNDEAQINCSEYEIIQPGTEKESLGLVVPIYSLTEGLYQWRIRAVSKEILKNYLRDIIDPYPEEFLKKHGLMPLQRAIINMHYPKDRETYKKAKGRIVFDEFFFLQLALAIRRHKQAYEKKGYAFNVQNNELIEKYFNALPFELTNAQKSAIEDIKKDMAQDHPMNRLIQGDVGSGKTEVAIAAILIAIENGYQTAFMAPTEILAEQQYKRILKYCNELNIKVLLLMGSIKGKEREKIINEIEKGEPLILVGTHALIQENIKIPKLGFAVIDEQHRFGVLQRTALKEKGYNPDLLFMTATPIPRSMLLTCYGDLDKSIIDELPPGRIPQATFFEAENNIEKIYDFIKAKLGDDEQTFIVYPLVEESEKIDLKAAVESAEYLKKNVFNKNDVALIHGRMKNDEKEEIMKKFREGYTKVLVSTTVIEVGVDVPKANIMVVMHAERFGLSQLHQLRGRVGRSDKKSYCFLIGDPKNAIAKERLMALVDSTDGFKIAEIDLKLRGPGDYYGLRQSGMPDFIIADIVKDEKILLIARKAAFDIVNDGLNKYPEIEREIRSRRAIYKIENILH